MMSLHVNQIAHVACNFNCLLDSRSQAVMYTVKGVICQKWCKLETLLQITNSTVIQEPTVARGKTLVQQPLQVSEGKTGIRPRWSTST